MAANTSYNLYVRSNCGGAGFGTWAGPYNFFTGHCIPTGATNYYLTNVLTTGGVTNINNTTSTGGYNNYSAISCSNYIGGAATSITLTPSSGTNYFYCWIDWNNDLDFNDANETIFATTSYTNNHTGSITIPSGTAVGNYRMRVANSWSGNITSCGPASNGEYEDYTFKVVAPPSCFPPSSLAVSAITSSSATVSWTAASPAPSSGYQWEVRTSGAGGSGSTGLAKSGSTAAGVLSASAIGLSSSTSYNLYVRSNCGGSGFSAWSGPVNFLTLCGALTVPWTENFDALVSVGPALYPPCWYKENGDWTSGYTGSTTYGDPRSAPNYIYNYYQANNEYIWTPGFALVGGTSYDFSFFYNGYDGSYNTWTADILTNTTQNSSGATLLSTFLAPPAYEPSVYTEVSRTFTPAISRTYYFAIRVNESTYGPWYLNFDDFGLVQSPSCLSPNLLTASAITSSSATVSWTAPSPAPSNGYQWEVRTSGAGGSGRTGLAKNGSTAAGVLSASAIGLAANTTFNLYVRSNCGGSGFSAWSGPVSFFTGHCIPTGATNYYLTNVLTTGGVTNINNTTSTGGYNNYSAISCSNYIGGAATSITLTPSGGTNHFYCWIDWNNDLDFNDANETIFATTSYDNNHTGSITIPSGTAVGNYRMRVANSWLGDITSCGPSTNGEYEDYTFKVIAPPSCFPPTSLVVSAIASSSATVSWTAASPAPSNGYQWEVRTSGAGGSGGTGLAKNGSTAAGVVSALASGLSSSTSYNLYVRSYCGGSDYSTWVGPVNFVTTKDYCGGDLFTDFGGTGNYPNSENRTWTICPDVPGGVVSVNFSSFNTEDGWDGLMIYDGPNTSAIGILSGSTFNRSTCPNGAWTGTGANALIGLNAVVTSTHPSGCLTFVFTSDGSGQRAGWEASVTCAVVTCPAPYAPTATAITSSAATLSWTAASLAPSNGYQWEVRTSGAGGSGGTGLATSGSTAAGVLSASATSLASSTSYSLYVRSNCGGSDYSTWVGPVNFETTKDYCGGDLFTDFAGVGNNYPHNENRTWTICPDNPTDKVSVDFSIFVTEDNYDALMIYDGPNTSSPLISSGLTAGTNATTCPAGSWRGTGSPGLVVSTAVGGCLTFVFTSDFNSHYAGWEATVSCGQPDYASNWISSNLGATDWCAGETRSVTIEVENTGKLDWTDIGTDDFSIGVKWNADPGYLVKVDALNLASGSTQTYSIDVTAPTTGGAENLTFDVIKEGCFNFADNSTACGSKAGPGNVVHTSAINVKFAPTAVDAGTDDFICSGSSSNLSGSATGVAINSTIFSETFDSGTWPSAWTRTNNGNNSPGDFRTSLEFGSIGNTWSGTGYTAHCLYFYTYLTSIGVSGDMITPSMDLSAQTSASLTFWIFNEDGTDILKVYANNASGAYTQVGATSYSVYTSWTQITIDLSAYVGSGFNDVKIKFTGTSDYGSTNIGIDDVEIVGGIIHSPTYAWSPAAGLSSTTIANPIATPSGPTTYVMTATSNGCSVKDSVDIIVNGGFATPISSVSLAATTTSSTCVVDDGNWHHFYNSDGELLASINSNNEDLGNTTIAITVGDSGPFGTGLPPGVCGYAGASGGEFVLPRYWDITVENQPNNPVDVVFYYKNDDVSAFALTVDAQNQNYRDCWGDVNVESDMMMTVQHATSQQPFASLLPEGGYNINDGHRQIAFQLSEFSGGKLHVKGGIHTGNPLPVELLLFKAKAVNNEAIQLDWITATEINNEGFEVQKSTDGVNFEKIGWIVGNGNTNNNNDYFLFDKDVQNEVIYYYRLKQLDFDGVFEYSKIVAASLVNFDKVEVSYFIPNPSSNFSSLIIEGAGHTQVLIEIMDNIGRKVVSKTQVLESGKNTFTFDLNEFSNGVYTAKIIMEKEEFTRKLVVRK